MEFHGKFKCVGAGVYVQMNARGAIPIICFFSFVQSQTKSNRIPLLLCICCDLYSCHKNELSSVWSSQVNEMSCVFVHVCWTHIFLFSYPHNNSIYAIKIERANRKWAKPIRSNLRSSEIRAELQQKPNKVSEFSESVVGSLLLCQKRQKKRVKEQEKWDRRR